MNIFKILANGDGTINEANISAFLGYLLDPYQDHGLGHEFLDRFLNIVNGTDVKNTYFYNYEIELEQAFRYGDKKKQIVDIVLASFNSNKNDFKESILQNKIETKQTLDCVYLIENKVNYNAKKPDQIKHQFEATKAQLNIDDEQLFSIYITPDLDVYNTEFVNYTYARKKHFKWIYDSEKQFNTELGNDEDPIESLHPSIYGILKNIIEEESIGKIEAINEYTKHTLISFLKFIQNDFKSQVQNNKDKKEGKFQKDFSATLAEYFDKYKQNLNDITNKKLEFVDEFVRKNFSKYYVRHTKTHPITILTNPNIGKIFSLTKNGKNVKYRFITRNFRNELIKSDLKTMLEVYTLKPIINDGGIEIFEEISTDLFANIFTKYIDIITTHTTN